MPGTTRAVLQIAEEQLASYLRGQAARGEALGVAVSASVRRGDPASVIVETAVSTDADIIVLGTHGKPGGGLLGSQRDRQGARENPRPLLLVPVTSAPAD